MRKYRQSMYFLRGRLKRLYTLESYHNPFMGIFERVHWYGSDAAIASKTAKNARTRSKRTRLTHSNAPIATVRPVSLATNAPQKGRYYVGTGPAFSGVLKNDAELGLLIHRKLLCGVHQEEYLDDDKPLSHEAVLNYNYH